MKIIDNLTPTDFRWTVWCEYIDSATGQWAANETNFSAGAAATQAASVSNRADRRNGRLGIKLDDQSIPVCPIPDNATPQSIEALMDDITSRITMTVPEPGDLAAAAGDDEPVNVDALVEKHMKPIYEVLDMFATDPDVPTWDYRHALLSLIETLVGSLRPNVRDGDA